MLYFDLCITMISHNAGKNSQGIYSEGKRGIQIDCFLLRTFTITIIYYLVKLEQQILWSVLYVVVFKLLLAALF